MNRQLLLARRPDGAPTPATWRLVETPVPDVGEGAVLVRVAYLSLEPAMRGWMEDRPSYLPPVAPGEVMRASGVGEVVESRHPALRPGDWVAGYLGVQQYCAIRAEAVRRIDLDIAPPEVHAGLLSSSGFAAYFGLTEIGVPKAGETVVVSGAAGAVGSIAGQIARILGCRTVGIAGGAKKAELLRSRYGFQDAIDYRGPDLTAAIRTACPAGVDVFFDNVGNPVLDPVLKNIAIGARVVLCGAVAQYNAAAVEGPRNYIALIVKRAQMRGFIMSDYSDRFAEASSVLAGWWRDGLLRYDVDITDGVDRFYAAYSSLFDGSNEGKVLLRP